MDRTCIKSRPLVTMGNVVALVLTVHVASPVAAHNINQTDVYFESDEHFLQPSHSPDYPDILDSAGHISNLERDFLEYDYNQFEEDENDTQIFQARKPRYRRNDGVLEPRYVTRRSNHLLQRRSPAERIGGGGGGYIRNPVSDLAGALVNGISNVFSSAWEDTNNAPQERIYRGAEARPHVWPWMAKVKTLFLARNERKRTCGGALISDMFVLTARHCVSWKSTGEVVAPRQVQVWLGSHALQGMDGLQAEVELIISRDDYEAPTCAKGVWCPSWAFWSHTTLTNDIVLLQLTKPVPLSRKIQPIKINLGHTVAHTPAWVGGWGLDGKHPTTTLQLTQVKIMEDDYRECRNQMSPSKICVVGEDKSGPCPGDSGSPLVVYEDAGPSLVGLVSNGAMKCTKGLPGIFTRVSYYVDWIDANVKVSLINAQQRESEKLRLKDQNTFKPKLGNPFQEQFWPNVFTSNGGNSNNAVRIQHNFSPSKNDINYGSFATPQDNRGVGAPVRFSSEALRFRRRRPVSPDANRRPVVLNNNIHNAVRLQSVAHPLSNRLGHLVEQLGVTGNGNGEWEIINTDGIGSTLQTFSDLLGGRRHRRRMKRFRGRHRRI